MPAAGNAWNSIEPVHPAVAEAREVIRLEQELRDATRPTDAAYRRLWRAIMLSPNITVCEALLRGETVPRNRLDAAWARRFGRRDAA